MPNCGMTCSQSAHDLVTSLPSYRNRGISCSQNAEDRITALPQLTIGSVIEKKMLLSINKILIDKLPLGVWSLTNEVQRTLTEWKPISRIYPMRTTSRSAELTSSRTRKLKKKNRSTY
jgi:hypothetical protein